MKATAFEVRLRARGGESEGQSLQLNERNEDIRSVIDL